VLEEESHVAAVCVIRAPGRAEWRAVVAVLAVILVMNVAAWAVLLGSSLADDDSTAHQTLGVISTSVSGSFR
jgi:hypothetical protein